jgi:hypothetical protein
MYRSRKSGRMCACHIHKSLCHCRVTCTQHAASKLQAHLCRWVQGAYQDEEAANNALQAVAPVGLKLLRHEALHLD